MKKNAFTILELLTVIAIIAVLAGILLPALNRARQQAWETTARTMISSLEAALANYMTDYGNYPSDDGTPYTSCSNLIARLESSGGNSYASFRSQDKDGSGNLEDPWSEPYCYRYSGTIQGSNRGIKFNIWSKGVDKQTNSSTPSATVNKDDLTNWKTGKGWE